MLFLLSCFKQLYVAKCNQKQYAALQRYDNTFKMKGERLLFLTQGCWFFVSALF